MIRNRNKRKIFFEEYRMINGINQYLFHAGADYDNPVMLFLHGMGIAESVTAHMFQRKWEELYTVVHLDQRGAGKTYTKNPQIKPTLEMQIKDIYEVVEYLKERYNKDKIVIVGHSWGSILGTIYTKRYPENVLYYIGTGQVVNVLGGERIGYEKARDIALERKDKKALKKLDSINEYPYKESSEQFIKNCTLLRIVQQKYKLVPTKASYVPLTIGMMLSPIFRLSDFSAMGSSEKVNEKINDDMMSFDLMKESREYKVPIYYILGKNDWQVPYTFTEEYYETIVAPRKKLYLIPGAGHFTMQDKPELYYNVLEQIAKSEL
jgi:pimeloyl-ACP methyl ester carboxylesterase